MSDVLNICRVAGIPFTKRQTSKFRNGYGFAFQANRLGLLEKFREREETGRSYRNAWDKFRGDWGNRNIDYKRRAIVKEQIGRLRLSKRLCQEAEQSYQEVKSALPKYSPHVG